MLSTRIHGWVSDKVVTQQFNQIKEFEELLYERGTIISKFFLYIFNNEQKGRFVDASRGGNGRDTTPQLFSIGLCDVMWGESHSTAESNPLARPLRLLSPKSRRWYSRFRWVCFVPNVLMRGKLISPLTCFSNGRKRNLRPIHSLDQGDRTGYVAVNRLPRQFS
ncbi:MAG TPA: hypothetical protein VFV44_07550 [Nitrospiraceae bacterium]|nr:hypothetical protein [Nitrospiraceae bacterium]